MVWLEYHKIPSLIFSQLANFFFIFSNHSSRSSEFLLPSRQFGTYIACKTFNKPNTLVTNNRTTKPFNRFNLATTTRYEVWILILILLELGPSWVSILSTLGETASKQGSLFLWQNRKTFQIQVRVAYFTFDWIRHERTPFQQNILS